MKLESQFSMKYDKQTSSKSSVLYQARYCAQEDISIAVCEDKKIKLLKHPFCLKNITDIIPVCSLPRTHYDSKLVVVLNCMFLVSVSKSFHFSISINPVKV